MSFFSSTVQNTLLRYGLHNHLNFLLPTQGNQMNRLGTVDIPFQEQWLEQVPWHSDFARNHLYNIVCLHCRWNQDYFARLLGPEAFFFTILRDPTEAFESYYSYANLEMETRMNLSTFINK